MKSITKYPFIKLISLVLALSLWLFVRSTSEGELEVHFPVELINTPPALIVTHMSADAISARLGGLRSQLEGLGERQQVVKIDLATAKAGGNDFAISPESLPIPKGVKVKQITPGSIQVTMEDLTEKTVRVRPLIKGGPTAGHWIADIRCEPATVTIQGAKSQLAGITEVYTDEVDISGKQGTIEREVTLRLGGLRSKGVQTVKVIVVIEKG